MKKKLILTFGISAAVCSVLALVFTILKHKYTLDLDLILTDMSLDGLE
jgi:hypothetical protein